MEASLESELQATVVFNTEFILMKEVMSDGSGPAPSRAKHASCNDLKCVAGHMQRTQKSLTVGKSSLRRETAYLKRNFCQ